MNAPATTLDAHLDEMSSKPGLTDYVPMTVYADDGDVDEITKAIRLVFAAEQGRDDTDEYTNWQEDERWIGSGC